MNSILSYQNVSKSYGKTRAIIDLTLDFPETGIVGLIGRNGSGKTTLLNLASGMILPTSGKIQTLGESSHNLSDESVAQIGVVPHKPQFMERLSIQQYLKTIACFYSTWDTSRVDQLLSHFELNPKQRILSLSEGQRQKLSIIVATGHHPRLLLMDEPMSNLDPISRASTIKTLWDMLIDDGVLIILSSHILNDVERVADWVCALDSGRLQVNESLDSLTERHQHWEFNSEETTLPNLGQTPGILHQRVEGSLNILDISEANRPELIKLRKQFNGAVESRHLSLEEIFPFISKNHENK